MKWVILLVTTFIIGCISTPTFAAEEAKPQLSTVLTQNLGDVFGFIKEAANSLTLTAKKEVPLYIKELLESKAYSVKVNIATYIITTTIILLTFLILLFMIIKCDFDSRNANELVNISLIMSFSMLVICFIIGICSVPDWMRELYNLQHAPRVVIVEYLKGMIK